MLTDISRSAPARLLFRPHEFSVCPLMLQKLYDGRRNAVPYGQQPACSPSAAKSAGAPSYGDRGFESTSLQRRVWCELSRSNFLDQDADSPLRSIQLASIARMWQAGTGQRPQKVDAG
jgi:hypothetical protein